MLFKYQGLIFKENWGSLSSLGQVRGKKAQRHEEIILKVILITTTWLLDVKSVLSDSQASLLEFEILPKGHEVPVEDQLAPTK